jgi:hypothetical protein
MRASLPCTANYCVRSRLPSVVVHARGCGPIQSKIATALLLILWAATSAFCQTRAEQKKIEYLIGAIETLPNATFIRNGVGYDAQHAADHLRSKWRLAGARVQTAEDFIAYCATASSESTQKYQIRFEDGRVMEAATYLRNKLRDYVVAANPAKTSKEIPFRSLSFPAAGDRIRA